MAALLRFATAGSVDDGKSTLIGRLLYDSKSIFEDQLEAVERTSRRRGDDYTNLALLTDGLRAEREQGITIDVAYRYFATPKRKFIIADTPGPRAVHAQHGHRRLDRRPGARAGRRPQGRASSSPGGTRSSPRCCGCRTSCCASTRWTSSTSTRRSSTQISDEFTDVRGQARDRRPHVHPDLGAARRQRRRALGQHAVVRGPAAAAPPRGRAHRLRPQPHRLPLPGAVRDPPAVRRAPRLPRLRRAGRRRRLKPGDEVVVLPSGFTSTVAAIDTFDGPVDEAFRRCRSRSADGRHRRQPRRHDLPAAQPADGHARTSTRWCAGCQRATPLRRGATLRDQAHDPQRAGHGARTLHYRLDVNTLHRDDERDRAGAQRHRPRHAADDARRSFFDEYRRNRDDRQLHPDRRGDERDGRRRDDPRARQRRARVTGHRDRRARTSSGTTDARPRRALGGARARAAPPCGSPAVRRRASRRSPPRSSGGCVAAGRAGLPARRRQPAPRPQRRPRLHRPRTATRTCAGSARSRACSPTPASSRSCR